LWSKEVHNVLFAGCENQTKNNLQDSIEDRSLDLRDLQIPEYFKSKRPYQQMTLSSSTKKHKEQLPFVSGVKGDQKFDFPPPTFDRIFSKPPAGGSKSGLYGRAYLRKYFPHQWKIYNLNMSSFRDWMRDERASQFFNKNMREDASMVVAVKAYLALRAPELAGLTFMQGGSSVTHQMSVDVLYKKFKEFKHDLKKRDSLVRGSSNNGVEDNNDCQEVIF